MPTDDLNLGVWCCYEPAPRCLDNALGEVAAEQHPTSVAIPKTDTLVSKVGPSSIRNNPKGPHLHEKPSNVIITNPLRKPINRGKEGEMGVVEWGVRNQRIRVRKLRRGGDKQRELAREGNKEQLEGYKNHALRSFPL